jgi:hypothetical protein
MCANETTAEENVKKMFDTTNSRKIWMDTCRSDFKL